MINEQKGLTLEERFARLPKDRKFRTDEGNVKEGVRILKRKILSIFGGKVLKTKQEMIDIIYGNKLTYDLDESEKVLNQLVKEGHFSYDKTRISGFGKCLYFHVLERPNGEQKYLVYTDYSPYE